MNLQPRNSEGIDYRLYYSLRNTPIGNFRWSLNVSQRTKLFQEASEDHQILLDAVAAGTISGVTVSGVEDLLRRNGRPAWKASSTVTWSDGPWSVGPVSYTHLDVYKRQA